MGGGLPEVREEVIAFAGATDALSSESVLGLGESCGEPETLACGSQPPVVVGPHCCLVFALSVLLAVVGVLSWCWVWFGAAFVVLVACCRCSVRSYCPFLVVVIVVVSCSRTDEGRGTRRANDEGGRTKGEGEESGMKLIGFPSFSTKKYIFSNNSMYVCLNPCRATKCQNKVTISAVRKLSVSRGSPSHSGKPCQKCTVKTCTTRAQCDETLTGARSIMWRY